jgi:hypothetical protein
MHTCTVSHLAGKDIGNSTGWRRSLFGKSWLAVLLLAAPLAHAAQFQLGAIIRAGANDSTWEIGAGDSAANPVSTGNDSPWWQDGVSQQFQVTYTGSTNTLDVKLYKNGSNSAFSDASYNPTGGPPASGAIWTIPAAAFYVQALAGPTPTTAITISNLALNALSGALNIIKPIQQTSLQATGGQVVNSSLGTQSQDIVFQADSTGSWQLNGFITLNGLNGPGSAKLDQLAMAVTAFAAATPEPGTSVLFLLGLPIVIGFKLAKDRAHRHGRMPRRE